MLVCQYALLQLDTKMGAWFKILNICLIHSHQAKLQRMSKFDDVSGFIMTHGACIKWNDIMAVKEISSLYVVIWSNQS